MDDGKNTINRELGQRIGKLRSNAKETQQQLSEAMGVSREIIMHWENGTRQIKADAIAKLARHYKVSADYLLGFTKADTNDKDLQFVCDYTGLSVEAVSLLNERINKKSLNVASISVNRFVSDFIEFYCARAGALECVSL